MMYEIGEKAIKSIDRECDEYEIYISEGKTTQLDSLKDELNFAKDEIEYGIGIRILKDNKLEGVAAVIDKDYASAKLAELINADYLVILTAVDNVCINFNKENEKKLTNTSKEELQKYLEEGHFAKGSMYPKVQAVLNFLKDQNKTAVIASLDNAKEAFKLKAGTIVR